MPHEPPTTPITNNKTIESSAGESATLKTCRPGAHFDGWLGRDPLPLPRGLNPPHVNPKGFGWRRYGLIEVDEVPGAQ